MSQLFALGSFRHITVSYTTVRNTS